MAVTIANIQKYIGAGKIYVNCAVPPPGASWLQYASNGVPSGGTEIGATQGESKFTYKATVEGVDIEQSFFVVAPHITAEDATITCNCLEPTVANVKLAMGGSVMQGTVTGTGAGTAIRFGGVSSTSGQCVCVVAEQATNPGKFYGGMIYTAVNDSGLERPFKKGKEVGLGFTFKSFPSTSDLSRPNGEICGQWSEET
jgi:hypothetical protein